MRVVCKERWAPRPRSRAPRRRGPARRRRRNRKGWAFLSQCAQAPPRRSARGQGSSRGKTRTAWPRRAPKEARRRYKKRRGLFYSWWQNKFCVFVSMRAPSSGTVMIPRGKDKSVLKTPRTDFSLKSLGALSWHSKHILFFFSFVYVRARLLPTECD